MALGSMSAISFNPDGTSVVASDPYSILFEKIKFFLGSNTNEILANPEYGGNLRYYNHKLVRNSNYESLKKTITVMLTTEYPYVSVVDITKIEQFDNVLAMSLVLRINEDQYEVPLEIGG